MVKKTDHLTEAFIILFTYYPMNFILINLIEKVFEFESFMDL